MVNVATCRAASTGTESYLINVLKRNQDERDNVLDDWDSNNSRFLQPVKRICVHNVAAQNAKRWHLTFREFSLIQSQRTHCHCDGPHPSRRRQSHSYQFIMCKYDGGLHSILSQTNMGASYASVARTVLSVICSGRASEVHVCSGKYVENSIRDSERTLRGESMGLCYNQIMSQSGQKLLTNGVLENWLAKFLFNEEGKNKPFGPVEKDETCSFINLFISMGEVQGSVDLDVASNFVCRMYVQRKTRDVNETRYTKLKQMAVKVYQENLLANIKRIDCALLPPCRRALQMRIRWTQYFATLCRQAVTACPGDGWSQNDSVLKPTWFDGPATPDSLFKNGSNHTEKMGDHDGSESELEIKTPDGLLNDSDGEAWSENSDSEEKMRICYLFEIWKIFGHSIR
ncbi:hypothetical protein ScPMuIL_007257 [Solemya velum]